MRALLCVLGLAAFSCGTPSASDTDGGSDACTTVVVESMAFAGASVEVGGATGEIDADGRAQFEVCPQLTARSASFEVTREGVTWSTTLDWEADAAELGTSQGLASMSGFLRRSSDGECLVVLTNLAFVDGKAATSLDTGTDALCGPFAE